MRLGPVPRFLCLLLALACIRAEAADLSLGGELAASTALASEGGEAAGSGYFRLSPLAVAGGGAWEFRLGIQAEAGNAPARSRLALSEARLRLWLGRSLSLAAGYGLESGGAAELFPLSEFFGPSDPLSRFEGGEGRARSLPEAAARIGLSGSLGSLSLALAPFAPPLVLPSLDSPWFPTARFPQAIEVAGNTLQFAAASYATLPDLGAFEFDPSYEVAAGIVAGPFDFGLRYFAGLERNPALFARIFDDVYQYRVELLPLRSRIRSLAFSTTGIFGALRLWAEAAYTVGASFATGSYEYGAIPGLYIRQEGNAVDFTAIPPVLPLDRFAATGGLGRDFELHSLPGRFLLEATYAWYPEAPPGSSPPELARAFAYFFTLHGLPGRLSASASGLFSLEDGSAALRPALSLDLGGERSLEASLPLFFGGEDEEFGRYRNHRFFVLSFSERF